MGRGRSKVGGGAGRGPAYKGSIDLGGDDSNIEFDGTLQYGANDPALSGKGREVIENWEKKRVKNKVEFAYAVDGNGDPVGREIRGSKGSVSVPRSYHDQEGGTFTHIHPREAGTLGGTFSQADLFNFERGRSKGTRAAAKEGTYSISKGKNFDGAGFRTYVTECNRRFHQDQAAAGRQLRKDFSAGLIDTKEYLARGTKAFNTALVNLHNAYAAGQKKYGYVYTLEQRK